VLAGGQSSRMGRDKALIELDGVTMLERAIARLRPHVREILVIGDPAKYVALHATTLPDDTPGHGPLGGITTGLRAARYVRLLVIACDLPHLNDRCLLHLKRTLTDAADAIVAAHDQGMEPLVAAYHKRCLEPFRSCLRQGRLKMTDALQEVRTVRVPIQPGTDGWPTDLFHNVNAPTDL
jgi:molybdopterin-guanine dinucleotide biosynthesis protein A